MVINRGERIYYGVCYIKYGLFVRYMKRYVEVQNKTLETHHLIWKDSYCTILRRLDR